MRKHTRTKYHLIHRDMYDYESDLMSQRDDLRRKREVAMAAHAGRIAWLGLYQRRFRELLGK